MSFWKKKYQKSWNFKIKKKSKFQIVNKKVRVGPILVGRSEAANKQYLSAGLSFGKTLFLQPTFSINCLTFLMPKSIFFSNLMKKIPKSNKINKNLWSPILIWDNTDNFIDWIGFNGHSTALVILGRPRERGRIHRKYTFEFLWFFNVSRV